MQKTLPIGPIKPSMTTNAGSSLAAQSSLGVFIQQFQKEIFEERVADKIEGSFSVADFVFDDLEFLMLNKKRRETGDHFEDQISKGPPIDSRADVDAFLENLRG